MANLDIELFSCRSDNFGVLLHDPVTGDTASIDAPEEAPILAALERRGWNLTHIFTTHHHPDHVEANLALKDRFGVRILGPKGEASKIPGIDEVFANGEHFSFAGHDVTVIATPGHTLGHICFYIADQNLLFAADTLFALGCGRLFEAPAPVMWESMQKLMALPDATQVYFGHEYTASNARFALTVDGSNAELVKRSAEITALRAEGLFTAPTTIGLEKSTNPYFRVADPEIRKTLGMETASDADVFGEIRQRKDNFR